MKRKRTIVSLDYTICRAVVFVQGVTRSWSIFSALLHDVVGLSVTIKVMNSQVATAFIKPALWPEGSYISVDLRKDSPRSERWYAVGIEVRAPHEGIHLMTFKETSIHGCASDEPATDFLLDPAFDLSKARIHDLRSRGLFDRLLAICTSD